MEYIATTLGNFRFDFPRITVILGANGSGKSTLLRAIKDKLPCVYVEGGRTISINDVIQQTRQTASKCPDHDPTLVRYKTKRKEKLVDRILDAILVLVEREQEIREAHADAVAKWEAGGKHGDSPPYEQPPLEKLFEQYAEVFPHIHLSYNYSNGRVTVTNDYAPLPYGPSELSDGEKQVFSLMADMLELEDEYSVVVVDEPELNLHPELAERLWALLESEYQSNHFIYATHSIQFALRPLVDALYVISSDPSKIRKISNPSEIPRNDLERFLAGFPGMLHGGSVIVTEGHEKSFDSLFYRWVLNDGKTEVFPCGNGSDVKQVIDKQGLWGQVSKDIRLSGVIDADHRSDQEMRQYSGPYLIPLSLHEAESYLCLPEVLVAAAHKIGSQESMPTVNAVQDLIFEELRKQRLSIALKRCFSDSTVAVRRSLERSVLTVTTREEAMKHIRDASAKEGRKAADAAGEKLFEQRLDRELADTDRVLADRDLLQALKLVPGKELLATLAPLAGCKNGTDLMRSIRKNLSTDQFEPIKRLSDALKLSMAQQGAPADV